VHDVGIDLSDQTPGSANPSGPPLGTSNVMDDGAIRFELTSELDTGAEMGNVEVDAEISVFRSDRNQ
jgi:hypothetical protein